MLADEVLAFAAKDARTLRWHKWTVCHLQQLAKGITEAERFVVSREVTCAIEELQEHDDPAALRLLEVCRMPFRSCWIEWAHENAPLRTGILVNSDTDGQRGTCMMVKWQTDVRDLLVLPVVGTIDWRQTVNIDDHLSRQTVAFEPSVPDQIRADCDIEWLCGAMLHGMFEARGVVVLLHTKNMLDTERQVIPERLQRARQKSGKLPLLEHTRIDIVLSERAVRREADDADDPRNPVRLHSVRRHLRLLNGRLIWVKAHMRGRLSQGVITQQTRILH